MIIPALVTAYIVMFLFMLGVNTASSNDLPVPAIISALIWPIIVPVWLGSFVQSMMEKASR